jgi:CRP/FNR family cyclic AMP-dependent transcriptional regulator
VDGGVLSGLGAEDRTRLLAVARRRAFSRGDIVFHRGDPADTLHLVVKGRFAARIVTPLGETVVLSLLARGDVFGELALLEEDARRSATVVAVEAAETRSVHKREFDALRAERPELVDVLLRGLAAQVQRLSDRLVEALYVPAEVRVLRRLLELLGTYGDGEGPTTIPLTQEELAGLAGTSRATVNRVLRDAERRGEVGLHRGRTVVLDPEAVARRARPEQD